MDAMTVERIVEKRPEYLAEVRKRQGIFRDYVRAVAKGYANGLYLHGPPGTAKTHTVREVLEEEIREIYVYQRGHLTPMGLFELIAATQGCCPKNSAPEAGLKPVIVGGRSGEGGRREGLWRRRGASHVRPATETMPLAGGDSAGHARIACFSVRCQLNRHMERRGRERKSDLPNRKSKPGRKLRASTKGSGTLLRLDTRSRTNWRKRKTDSP